LDIPDDCGHIFSKIRQRHVRPHIIQAIGEDEEIRLKIDNILVITFQGAGFGGLCIARATWRNGVVSNALVMILEGFLLAGINQPDEHICEAVLLALEPRPTLHRTFPQDDEAFERAWLVILRPFGGFPKTLLGILIVVALPTAP